MRAGASGAATIGRLRRASAHHVALRVAVLLGATITVTGASLAAGSVLVPAAIVLGLLAVVGALFPDSNVGLLLVAGLVWHWAAVVDSPRTPLVVPAAAGMLLVHVGMAMAATTPVSVRWSSRTLTRWRRRTSVVAAAICAAWGLTLAVHAVDVAGGAAALVAAALLIAATAVALRSRSVADAATDR